MEFNKAKTTVTQRAKDLFSKVSTNTILSLVILGLVIHINTMDKEKILIPPHLSEEVSVGRNYASKEYLQHFAYWLVGVISSINADNADEVHKWVHRYFKDEVWSNLGPQILAIKSNPNFTGVNLMNYFSVEGIEYEPRSETFYVYGKLTSAQYRKGRIQPVRSIMATYEVRMEMFNGIPRVTHWRPYEGVPMTESWKEKHPEQAQKRETELEKTLDNNQTLPHADESDIVKEKDYSIGQEEEKTEKAASEPAPKTEQNSQPQSPENAASQIMKGVQPPETGTSSSPVKDDQL